MDLLKLLYELMPLTNMNVADLLNVEDTYKTVLKNTKLTLKQLHPDAGGSAAEFDRLHKLYEVLLTYKKKNSDYEEKLKKAIRRLSSTDLTPDVFTGSKEISFEDILSQSIILPAQHKFNIQVDIAELVTHFNKLSYCQVKEVPSLSVDMVSIPIDIIAIEPAERNKTTTSNVTLQQWAQHNYSGRYETIIALSVKSGSILKINPRGFEQIIVRNIETAENFKLVFEEGTVVLSVLMQVAIEK